MAGVALLVGLLAFGVACPSASECEVDADCTDDDLCTEDQCVGGACSNLEIECEDDGDLCTAESCDSETGSCQATPAECMEGERCDPETGDCIEVPVEQIEIVAVKDNTIFDEADLSNGAGDYIFAGRVAAGEIRRALLAFDIAETIPVGSTIHTVTLVLNMSRTIADSQIVVLRRVLSDWGEGASHASGEEGAGIIAETDDATWIHTLFPSSLWEAPGGDFSETIRASAQVAGVGAYAWGPTPELTEDVQDWLDNPEQDFGWILIGPEDIRPTAKRFDSRENTDPAVRPLLTIEFSPPLM